jgi:hypothetical protein
VSHHTDLDRIDQVRAGDVGHSAKVIALAALRLADHERLLPRDSAGAAIATP